MKVESHRALDAVHATVILRRTDRENALHLGSKSRFARDCTYVNEVMLGDLKNPRLIVLKAMLLVIVGATACAILLIESPHIRTVLLLAIAIWGFCRAYYFAFYVIEHYIDPQFKFVGLISAARYLMKRRG